MKNWNYLPEKKQKVGIRGGTKFHVTQSYARMSSKNIVLVEDPHISSRASLVLLRRVYEQMCTKAWVKFREGLLDAAEARDGCLKCHYCGRKDLIREISENRIKQPSNLATIDHVIPKSHGGQDTEENCVIACYKCNQEKGNDTKGEWNENSRREKDIVHS